MDLQKKLLPLILALNVSIAVQAQPNSVEMSIVGVTERLDPPKGAATGVMTLQFTNKQAKPVKIDVACPVFAAYPDASMRNSKKLLRVGNGSAQQPGFDCATVVYQWYSERHPKVADGISDLSSLSSPELEIGPTQRSEMLYVPMKIPGADGKYILKVLFDNVRLLEDSHTHGDADPRSVFFSACAEVHVQITTRRNGKPTAQ